MRTKHNWGLCQTIMIWLCSSEWDVMHPVLANVYPNLAFQTKEALLRDLLQPCSLRQLNT